MHIQPPASGVTSAALRRYPADHCGSRRQAPARRGSEFARAVVLARSSTEFFVFVLDAREGHRVANGLQDLAGDKREGGPLHHRGGVERLFGIGAFAPDRGAEGTELAHLHRTPLLQMAVDARSDIGAGQRRLFSDALAEFFKTDGPVVDQLGVELGCVFRSVF